MLQEPLTTPRRVLISVDAVGGVWRHGLDLARGLGSAGIESVLLGFGPPPSSDRVEEASGVASASLVWSDHPLDWMVEDEEALSGIASEIERVADRHEADLLHLNLPSQARGLAGGRPVVVASHSCVVTWWAAMRRERLPEDWRGQRRRNREGFDAADAVIAPSGSHAEALERAYGPIEGLDVVLNAAHPFLAPTENKQSVALAAGRWWDEAKNASCLDAAAAFADTPIQLMGPARAPNGQEFTARHAEALGERPAAETRAAMAQSAIFVSPARYEPFGLAILEAALAECALVLSDIPTFREIWDGAAMFVSPDDPKAVALLVDWLAQEPGLRREMAERAQARARNFTLDAQVDDMLRIYARAMSPGERSQAIAGA